MKHNKTLTPETRATIPDTLNARILRSAIRMMADGGEIHKKCDRRSCRTQKCCQSEGVLEDRIAHCSPHWSEEQEHRFAGAAAFGLCLLSPRLPKGANVEDYRWKPGVENPHDVELVITWVPRYMPPVGQSVDKLADEVAAEMEGIALEDDAMADWNPHSRGGEWA